MKTFHRGYFALVFLSATASVMAHELTPETPKGCPDIAGIYQFENEEANCKVSKPTTSYYVKPGTFAALPFPVLQLPNDSFFEIVQNGCKDIQINTKGEHLKAFNFTLTSTGKNELKFSETVTKGESYYSKITQENHWTLSLKGTALNIVTGYKTSDNRSSYGKQTLEADCSLKKFE